MRPKKTFCGSTYIMRRARLRLVVISVFLLLALSAAAQKGKSKKPAKKPVQKTAPKQVQSGSEKKTVQKPAPVDEKTRQTASVPGEEKVRDIIAFLEYMLNT